MNTIKELDVALLQQYRHRIHLYFGEADDWVGKNKDTILKAFEADEENVKVAHGHPDIPHSFCISEYMYTTVTIAILRPHTLATRSRRGGRGAVLRMVAILWLRVIPVDMNTCNIHIRLTRTHNI